MAGRQDREPFELFLIHEARLLDERRFHDWMALFTDDGTYWVPAVPGQSSPFDQASLFYDDRDLLKTRIDRLGHPYIHVQTPPSRTAHIIGNVTIEAADEAKGEFTVSSTVLMAEYRDEQQRLFAGRQTHKLRRVGAAEKDSVGARAGAPEKNSVGASFRIVQKRVDLINCDSAFEAMAVPI